MNARTTARAAQSSKPTIGDADARPGRWRKPKTAAKTMQPAIIEGTIEPQRSPTVTGPRRPASQKHIGTRRKVVPRAKPAATPTGPYGSPIRIDTTLIVDE